MYGCTPDPACNCHPWSIGSGETWPLRIDWTAWLASIPGYQMFGVPSITIENLNVSPATSADPEEIDTVPSYLGEQVPPDVATRFVGPMRNISETLIAVGADVQVGRLYRLNINVSAKDCDNRVVNIKDCVFIRIEG